MAKLKIDKYELSGFIEKEENIWACIYRGINRKKDNGEYDENPNKNIKRSLSFSNSDDKVKLLTPGPVLMKVKAIKNKTISEEDISQEDHLSENELDDKGDFSEHSSFEESDSDSDDFKPIFPYRIEKH